MYCIIKGSNHTYLYRVLRNCLEFTTDINQARKMTSHDYAYGVAIALTNAFEIYDLAIVELTPVE